MAAGWRRNAFQLARRASIILGRIDQDCYHGLLDLSGGEPPALRAIRSGLGDQGGGDVIAIASAFLDRMGWRKPLAAGIDQQARQ